MSENHLSSGSKNFLVIPGSPVPSKPLEVFVVDKVERVNFSEIVSSVLVSHLRLRSLSLVIYSSPYFSHLRHAFFFFLSSHCREFDSSHNEINHNGFVLLPERPLGFQGHTGEAVKLLPEAVIGFDKPGPIKHLDIVELIQLLCQFFL